MKKVAIIGAGIFGCSAALALSQDFDVSLFERSNDIIQGATASNHLRHHHGFHYPRSKETAIESIKSKESFDKEYGAGVVSGFPAYYAIAKEGSKTSPQDFLKFCDNLNLKYEIVKTPSDIFDTSKIALCIKTKEEAYNPNILRNIVKEKLSKSRVTLNLSSDVVSGKINGLKKAIQIERKDNKYEEEFDFVISATYTNFNKVNSMFDLPKKKVEYALMELIDVKIPFDKHVAAFIADGDFSTFVPSGAPGTVRLGHVKESVLSRTVSDSIDADSLLKNNSKSNKDKILSESVKYYPFLKDAKFIKSLFTTRIIKANVDSTDERLTEITSHGNGIYSIFGGKVITAVSTAEKMKDLLSTTVI